MPDAEEQASALTEFGRVVLVVREGVIARHVGGEHPITRLPIASCPLASRGLCASTHGCTFRASSGLCVEVAASTWGRAGRGMVIVTSYVFIVWSRGEPNAYVRPAEERRRVIILLPVSARTWNN